MAHVFRTRSSSARSTSRGPTACRCASTASGSTTRTTCGPTPIGHRRPLPARDLRRVGLHVGALRGGQHGPGEGPPARGLGRLATYRWPDPDDPAYYAGMEERFAGSEGKYVTTGIFMLLFERMHSLRGFENALTDLYAERERIEILADRIVEFDLGIIRNVGAPLPRPDPRLHLHRRLGHASWRPSSARGCGATSSSRATRASSTPPTPRAGTSGCTPAARSTRSSSR